MKKKNKYKIIYYEGEPSKYGINKKGEIINMKTNHVMKQRLNINGYYMVRLSFEKYHRDEVLVHRLLALYFIDNPENKPQVHHIDKNKLNNDIKNLLWVTEEEHKLLHENDENHPFSKGENHSRAILSDDDVHKICLFIETNQYSQHELAVMFGVGDQTIHEIRWGHNWTYISELYDFSKYTKLDWKATTETVVRDICEDIISNKFSAKEIAERNNVNVDVVQRIRRCESFKDIVSQYDLSVNSTIRMKDNITNQKIIDLMNQGKTNSEIICILNLSRGCAINTKLSRIRKKVINKL